MSTRQPDTQAETRKKKFEQQCACRGEVTHDARCLDEPSPMMQFFHDEADLRPNPNYMMWQAQHDNPRDRFNAKARAITVDWLVDVHKNFCMKPDSLFLAVNIIDRYFSLQQVERSKWQLVGVVALLIARRDEAIHPPNVGDFAYITDNTYTVHELLEMEAAIRGLLNCQIATPTPFQFLVHLRHAGECTLAQAAFTHYVLELALLDVCCLEHLPSVLASAAMLLSKELLERKPIWTLAMEHLTRCSKAALQDCKQRLLALVQEASSASLTAAYRKYTAQDYFWLACVPLGETGPCVWDHQ